jgi:hypothetical protein
MDFKNKFFVLFVLSCCIFFVGCGDSVNDEDVNTKNGVMVEDDGVSSSEDVELSSYDFKSNCYLDVAGSLNVNMKDDAVLTCELIDDVSLKDDCLINIAKNLAVVSTNYDFVLDLCDSVADKDLCLVEVSSSLPVSEHAKSLSLCENIDLIEYKEECLV